jgi:ketosteroid isomerase-like protein
MKRQILTSLSVLALTATSIPSITSLRSDHTQSSNSVEVQPIAEITAQTRQELSDKAALRRAFDDWVAGWSIGTKPFSFERLKHVYAQDDTLLAFDAVSPTTTIISGWDNYTALWQPFMEQYTYWTWTPRNDLRTQINGDMALTTMTVDIKGTHKNGSKVNSRVHASLVWEKQNGEWVIIHEHISSPVR